MSSQSRETLPAAASDTKQQTIAERLANNPTDATQMFHGINEQNEMHLGRVDLIIVVQVLIDSLQHLQT